MDHTDMSEQERDVLYNLLFADLVFHSIGVDIIETRKYDFCWGERRRSKEKVMCTKHPQTGNLQINIINGGRDVDQRKRSHSVY